MKQRSLSLLLLLCLSIAIAQAQQKLNIIFIGNSITYGAEIDHLKEAPPVRVFEQLSSQGYQVQYRNCGVSGSTTLDWHPSRQSNIFKRMRSAADELSKQPGQLIFNIMLGTNDSAIDCCTGAPASPQDYKKNLKALVDYLLESYPESRVVVNYPIWYSPHTYNATRYLHQGLDRLRTYLPQIDTLCQQYQATHPNRVFEGSKKVFSYFEGRTNLFVAESSSLGQGLKFYLHPNPKGATRLARFWTKSIKRAAK